MSDNVENPDNAGKRMIDIDLDVYKAIESQRLNFEETHDDILKRVLAIIDGSNKLDEKTFHQLYPVTIEECFQINRAPEQYRLLDIHSRINLKSQLKEKYRHNQYHMVKTVNKVRKDSVYSDLYARYYTSRIKKCNAVFGYVPDAKYWESLAKEKERSNDKTNQIAPRVMPYQRAMVRLLIMKGARITHPAALGKYSNQ